MFKHTRNSDSQNTGESTPCSAKAQGQNLKLRLDAVTFCDRMAIRFQSSTYSSALRSKIKSNGKRSMFCFKKPVTPWKLFTLRLELWPD